MEKSYRVVFATCGPHKAGDIASGAALAERETDLAYLLRIGAIECVEEAGDTKVDPTDDQTDDKKSEQPDGDEKPEMDADGANAGASDTAAAPTDADKASKVTKSGA